MARNRDEIQTFLRELLGGAAADGADEWFVATLTDKGVLGPDEWKPLLRWWFGRRGPRTNLAEFLVAQEICVAGADKALRLMARGYLSEDLLSVQVFAADGATSLRERVRQVMQAEETLHKGPDTRHTFRPGISPATVEPPVPAGIGRADGNTAESDAGRLVGNDSVRLTIHPDAHPLSPAVRALPGPNPTPAVGDAVGRCILTERVGRGATGLVFRALHQSLGIPVAVKVLHRDALENDRNGAQQLRTEARLLAQLNHPNIVRVWDFEESEPFPYLILEYVEGWSLSELIQQSGRLRPDRAASIMIQVAAGLAAARAIGVVHRDVKPANILLSKEGTAKLADLGLAVVLRKATARTEDAVAAEATAGTAAYMSPEQVTGGRGVDHRSDIYALGATFYHALTGQIPFQGRSRLEVMLKHTREAPVPPDQLVSEVGPALSAVVLKMMAKQPGDRHQTYEELRADLLAGRRSDEPGSTSPPAGTEAPTRSFWQNVLLSFGRKKTAS
jgi:tRNA A-37 threonylcarbamoyl transferase component Bud32